MVFLLEIPLLRGVVFHTKNLKNLIPRIFGLLDSVSVTGQSSKPNCTDPEGKWSPEITTHNWVKRRNAISNTSTPSWCGGVVHPTTQGNLWPSCRKPREGSVELCSRTWIGRRPSQPNLVGGERLNWNQTWTNRSTYLRLHWRVVLLETWTYFYWIHR